MEKITDVEIAGTIKRLMLAGKRMPVDASGDMAMSNLKETIAIWQKAFGDTPKDRWERAEGIALVARGIPGLNTNVVSMALMDYALEQDTKNHIAKQEQKAEEDKAWRIAPPSGNSYYSKATSYLIHWTARKMAGHSSIEDNLPSDQAVREFAKQIGIRVETPTGENTTGGLNYRVLQTYLADVNFCKTRCNRLHCYNHGNRPKLSVSDGYFEFAFEGCGK